MAKKTQHNSHHPAPSEAQSHHQQTGESPEQPQVVQKVVPAPTTSTTAQPESKKDDYTTIKQRVEQKHLDIVALVTSLTLYTYALGLLTQIYQTAIVQKIVSQVEPRVSPYATVASDYVKKAIDLHYTIIATAIFYAFEAKKIVFSPFEAISSITSQIRDKITTLIAQAKEFSLVQFAQDRFAQAKALFWQFVDTVTTRLQALVQPLLDKVQPYIEQYQLKERYTAIKTTIQQNWAKFKVFIGEVKQLLLTVIARVKQIITPTVQKPATTQDNKKTEAELFRPRFVDESIQDYTRQQVQLGAKTIFSAAKRLIASNNPPTETAA